MATELWLLIALLATILAAAAAGWELRGDVPVVTITILAALIVGFVAQALTPQLQTLWQRDAVAIEKGEWWRLLTALFVQDAGVPGALSNIAVLAAVGTLAERRWGKLRWLLIFFVGGLSDELVGLVLQPIGAGNSIANFSLAASLSVAMLLDRHSAPVALGAAAAILSELILVVMGDIHGTAALFGALLGAIFWLGQRRRKRLPAAAT